MLTTVEIPHLQESQKIRDYKKLFRAATATYKAGEQLACLPLYVHRTAGEKELAYQASGKASIDAAFTFLEELIDGPPCVYKMSEEFFSFKPKSQSMDAIRSYYFELYEFATLAGIPSDVFVKRFLTNINGGKKLYYSYKDDFNNNLNSDEVTALFKKMMEKIKKHLKEEKVIKEEPEFVFKINHTGHDDESMPLWAKSLHEEVRNLKCQQARRESADELDYNCSYNTSWEWNNETEMYPMQAYGKNKSYKSKPSASGSFQGRDRDLACNICKKTGHRAKNCFNRRCFKCEGKGHDVKDCPSNFNSSKAPRTTFTSNR